MLVLSELMSRQKVPLGGHLLFVWGLDVFHSHICLGACPVWWFWEIQYSGGDESELAWLIAQNTQLHIHLDPWFDPTWHVYQIHKLYNAFVFSSVRAPPGNLNNEAILWGNPTQELNLFLPCLSFCWYLKSLVSTAVSRKMLTTKKMQSNRIQASRTWLKKKSSHPTYTHTAPSEIAASVASWAFKGLPLFP